MNALQETLERIRKQFDIWPWLEVAPAKMLARSPSGTPAAFNVTAPYRLFFFQNPFVGWDRGAPLVPDAGYPDIGDLSIDAGTINWWTGAQPDVMQQAQQALTTANILGAYNDRWITLPRGQFLDINEPWQAQFLLGSAYNNNGGLIGDKGAQLYTGLRGYQLFPKGSISEPLQLSRREMLESGRYRPRSYTFACTANATFQTVDEAGPLGSFQLTISPPGDLNCDFMCHRIRIRPQSVPVSVPDPTNPDPLIYGYIPAVMVGIVPTTRNLAFQGGYASQQSLTLAPWQMFQGVDYSMYAWGQKQVPPQYFPPVTRLDTQWVLPHPVTFKNQERINFNVQALQVSAKVARAPYIMPMELALDGELLIRS